MLRNALRLLTPYELLTALVTKRLLNLPTKRGQHTSILFLRLLFEILYIWFGLPVD